METIFDYQPTPDELRYLARPDPDAYRARVTPDEALEALSMLFAMRGDEVRSDAYAAQILDKAYLLFELDNHDLIAPASIRKSASSGIDCAIRIESHRNGWITCSHQRYSSKNVSSTS